jgi:uncharacterized ferritin-like protein (DUF455 family)
VSGVPTSVREFCLRILESGDLATKLAPPTSLRDDAAAQPVALERPARDPEIALRAGAPRLPRDLGDPSARIVCLARFAHHELMAVELFAWALLRWPSLPPALRRGLLRVLSEEQTHCRLYCGRLTELGSDLREHTLSDYFWQHVPAIDASESGVLSFLSAMGLTLEQANLDFSRLYAEAFRTAGDAQSADICQRVHEEEIGHVRLAASWMARLSRPGESEIEAYERAVPFPLSAARAKARRFDADARRSAGLSDEFIHYVKSARSSQETQSRPVGPGERAPR